MGVSKPGFVGALVTCRASGGINSVARIWVEVVGSCCADSDHGPDGYICSRGLTVVMNDVRRGVVPPAPRDTISREEHGEGVPASHRVDLDATLGPS